MSALFEKALGFLPSWVPFVVVGALLALLGGGLLELKTSWQNEATAKASLSTVEQANDSLRQSLANREAFENDVRQGFKDLTAKVGGLQATNQTFKSQVKSDATSSAPISDGDRTALCGLLGASAAGCPGPAR